MNTKLYTHKNKAKRMVNKRKSILIKNVKCNKCFNVKSIPLKSTLKMVLRCIGRSISKPSVQFTIFQIY